VDKPTEDDAWDTTSEKWQVELEEQGLRKAQGSFYTPIEFARQIAVTAIDRWIESAGPDPEIPRIIDPSCGSGNFLLVASNHLASRMHQMGLFENFESAIAAVVNKSVYGTDIDEKALEFAIENLSQLGGRGVDVELLRSHLVALDPLSIGIERGIRSDELFAQTVFERDWSSVFPEVFNGNDNDGFEIVIGNPPFVNPMGKDRPYSSGELAEIATNLGLPLTAIETANISTLFLFLAQEICQNTGGVVAFVQPLSVIGVNRTLGVGDLIRQSRPFRIWFRLDRAFDANVETIVIFTQRDWNGSCSITTGRDCVEIAIRKSQDQPNFMSECLADVLNIPHLSLVSGPTVSSLAIATNDFRDQFYGMQQGVLEEEFGQHAKLATTALIDFGVNKWGSRETTFAKAKMRFPRVDVPALSGPMQTWAAGKLVPKVIVSTQTKIVEAWVDELGEFLPSIPLISIVPSGKEDVWMIAAAVGNPVSSVFAFRNFSGSGMTGKVLKLNGAQIGNVPLPSNRKAWSEAASILKELHHSPEGDLDLLRSFGEAIIGAYEVDNQRELVDWWLARV
jgi:hypothetical protein